MSFDDIRPLNNTEVHDAIENLLSSESFQRRIPYVYQNLCWDDFAKAMRACKTKEEFKSTMAYGAVMTIAKATTFSLTISGRSRLPKDMHPCTFVSNHRDIVCDAAFLNTTLYDVGYGMTQIAIGDNLLVRPWIKTLVRLNNSFIVKRNIPVRQIKEASEKLSSYIHHTIKETKESVWIAQREGRSKDSDDRTQTAVLKMLAMGGTENDILDNLISLNIVPVAISYEIDPCDYLKAMEFQLKRDNPDYTKSALDDLKNMEIGLLGFKGRVHFTIVGSIFQELKDLKEKELKRSELFTAIANVIDNAIYKHYRFYPRNYVAYDMLKRSKRFSANYSTKEKEEFESYLQAQLDKIDIPNKDNEFLLQKMLEMYSNPLINHLSS